MSMLAFCSASITMYELISSGAGSCFQPEMWNPQPLPAFSGRSQFSGQKFSSATLLLSEYSFGKQNDTVDWGCTCVLDSKQRPAPGTTWAWCSSAAAALGRTPWTRRTLFGASPPGPPQWLNPPRTPHATPWGGGALPLFQKKTRQSPSVSQYPVRHSGIQKENYQKKCSENGPIQIENIPSAPDVDNPQGGVWVKNQSVTHKKPVTPWRSSLD